MQQGFCRTLRGCRRNTPFFLQQQCCTRPPQRPSPWNFAACVRPTTRRVARASTGDATSPFRQPTSYTRRSPSKCGTGRRFGSLWRPASAPRMAHPAYKCRRRRGRTGSAIRFRTVDFLSSPARRNTEMQTTKQLLDRAKKAQGIESDYKLAQTLGVVQTAVTNWRSGRSHPDDERAARLAELAGQSAEIVVAELHAERAKTPETRQLWMRMAMQLRTAGGAVAATALSATLLIAGAPTQARAATPSPASDSASTVHYVKSHASEEHAKYRGSCNDAL